MGLDLVGAARLMVVLESLGPEGARGPLDYLCVALLARVEAGRLSFEQLLQEIGLHLEDKE